MLRTMLTAKLRSRTRELLRRIDAESFRGAMPVTGRDILAARALERAGLADVFCTPCGTMVQLNIHGEQAAQELAGD